MHMVWKSLLHSGSWGGGEAKRRGMHKIVGRVVCKVMHYVLRRVV